MLLKQTCLVGGLLGLLTFALVYGQNDPQRPAERGAGALSYSGDALLASWLIEDNQNEVALAQMAQQKATNDQVKQFAKRMILDHTALVSKLQKFSSGAGAAPNADVGRATPSSAKESGSVDVVALKKELARQCLSSAKREFEQKSGAEFDKCYMFAAVGAHMGAVDTLTVFQNHASPELKRVLSESLPTVKGHLDHAKTLAKELEGKSSGTTKSSQ